MINWIDNHVLLTWFLFGCLAFASCILEGYLNPEDELADTTIGNFAVVLIGSMVIPPLPLLYNTMVIIGYLVRRLSFKFPAINWKYKPFKKKGIFDELDEY